MATDMPLEEVSKMDIPDEDGGEYNPEQAEIAMTKDTSPAKAGQSQNGRATRSKSPQGGDSGGKTSKKDIDCKIFLLNGDVLDLSVDVSVLLLSLMFL